MAPLVRWLPAPAKEALRRALRRALVRGSSDVLASLHAPAAAPAGSFYFEDRDRLRQPRDGSSLPIPPATLRMGYAVDSPAHYEAQGRRSAQALRALLAAHDVAALRGEAGLDWGCASGRVLRHFAAEAAEAGWWGVDVHAPSIAWANQNLAPPFQFATATAFPALPLEDGRFGFAYGLSVFTHLEHLEDAWLLELRRVLRSGGHAIFSVQDEATLDFFRHKGRPPWLPAGLSLDAIAAHERTVVRGESWGGTHVFHSRRWIEREWGRAFDVLGWSACAEGHQSLVLLRKP